MKAIISAIIVAGALSQMANAMGPMGDITHRHFYKDQEWLWQKEDSRSKAKIRTESESFTGGSVWNVPVASGLPKRLSSPMASVLPTHPATASVLPTHPLMASVLPTHPRTASVLPTHPLMASVLPTHPLMASVLHTHPTHGLDFAG
jgi:hypothetical protein